MKNYNSLRKGLDKHLRVTALVLRWFSESNPHSIDTLALLKPSFFTPYLSVLGPLGQADSDIQKKNLLKI